MAVHMISYDLISPGKNYDNLIEAIKAIGPWAHPLKSQWLVVTSFTQAQTRDYLLPHIDANDRLLVVALTKQIWASKSLPQDVVNWLNAHVSG